MTSALDLLKRRIAASGPVTVAEFMRLALAEHGAGYYATRDPLGSTGDFITAPEISQMFGELIGLWCVDAWERAGAPDPFLLVELGPGRGTLMADALRAAKVRPPFLSAMRLHLVEISRPLREAQEQRLGAFHPLWHDDLTTLPEGPALIVGNEFLDALPIHQFQMTEHGWRERAVDLAQRRARPGRCCRPGRRPACCSRRTGAPSRARSRRCARPPCRWPARSARGSRRTASRPCSSITARRRARSANRCRR